MDNSGFGWVLLGCAIFGFVHSLLATNTLKSIVQRRCTSGVFRSYRLIYNLFAGVCSVGLAALVLLLPDQTLYRIPAPWVYLTLALQALILLGMLFAFRQSAPWEFLGLAQFRSKLSLEQSPLLVITGFYRYCRHPLYFFGLGFIWLFPLMTWNLLALFAGLTIYTLLGSLLEERRLLRTYGGAYRAYMRDVPWLIPNPINLFKK